LESAKEPDQLDEEEAEVLDSDAEQRKTNKSVRALFNMPRPRLGRRIAFQPDVTYFKPAGIGVRFLEQVDLEIDELEAIRLFDAEGKPQEECAKKMEVSQPTFSRILSSARKKIADALVKGKAIRIENPKA